MATQKARTGQVRSASVDDLGSAAGVMGVIDTLVNAAAAGEQVAVVRRDPKVSWYGDEAARAQREAEEYRKNGIVDGDGQVVTAERVIRDRAERGIYSDDEAKDVLAALTALTALSKPKAVNEDRDRDAARAAMNGGRYAGPRKEQQVKDEAGPAAVAARTARARRQTTKERLTSSPYVAHVVEKAAAKYRAERAAAEAAPKPVKVPKATKAPAEPAPEGMRHCPGVPKYDIGAHLAPVVTWGPVKSRTCHACWVEWGKRRVAAKGAPGATTSVNARSRAEDTAPVVVVDGTEAQKAEHAALESALAEVGVETEAGQDLLAQAAAEAAAARRAAAAEAKRRQRARAKAAAQVA